MGVCCGERQFIGKCRLGGSGGNRLQGSCVLLIGPEGDFSPAEYAAGESAGYAPASLGPIILRVETAVFLAVASARYALDA